jgi:hypothetical protein
MHGQLRKYHNLGLCKQCITCCCVNTVPYYQYCSRMDLVGSRALSRDAQRHEKLGVDLRITTEAPGRLVGVEWGLLSIRKS